MPAPASKEQLRNIWLMVFVSGKKNSTPSSVETWSSLPYHETVNGLGSVKQSQTHTAHVIAETV